MSLDFKCALECPECEKRTQFTLSLPDFPKVRDVAYGVYGHGERRCSFCTTPFKVETEITFEVMTFRNEIPSITEQIEDREYD